MKKIFLLAVLTLAACSAQPATPVLNPTAEIPPAATQPPTATAVPLPTVSPELTALQEKIAAETSDVTLKIDGTIEYKGQVYKDTLCDGVVCKIMVDGKEVVLEQGQFSFSDEDGFVAKGYTYDEEKGFVKNKEFNIAACTVEHIFDEKINVEDLPAFHDWLNTLSKPFDASKIKDDVSLMRMRGELNEIIYDWRTAPNWEDLEATGKIAPFRRDVTCAYLEYEGYVYLVLPIEYYDPNEPTKNKWVITLQSMYWPGHSPEESNKLATSDMNIWQDEMNITPIVTTDQFQDARRKVQDPLVAKVFAAHPDLLPDGTLNPDGMEARFQRFMEGDLTGLADRDIFLLTDIGDSSRGWLE